MSYADLVLFQRLDGVKFAFPKAMGRLEKEGKYKGVLNFMRGLKRRRGSRSIWRVRGGRSTRCVFGGIILSWMKRNPECGRTWILGARDGTLRIYKSLEIQNGDLQSF